MKRTVADSATSRFRVSESIHDDPLIDRARLCKVGLRTARDFVCRRFHNAVGRQELCSAPEMFQLCQFRFRGPVRGRGNVDRIIPCRHSAGERQNWLHARRKFRDKDSEPIDTGIGDSRRPSLGDEVV